MNYCYVFGTMSGKADSRICMLNKLRKIFQNPEKNPNDKQDFVVLVLY